MKLVLDFCQLLLFLRVIRCFMNWSWAVCGHTIWGTLVRLLNICIFVFTLSVMLSFYRIHLSFAKWLCLQHYKTTLLKRAVLFSVFLTWLQNSFLLSMYFIAVPTDQARALYMSSLNIRVKRDYLLYSTRVHLFIILPDKRWCVRKMNGTLQQHTRSVSDRK